MSSKVAFALLVALLATACALHSSADWAYVSEVWGGIEAGAPRLEKKVVVLPLRLQLHPPSRADSAICINGLNAKTKQRTVYVSLEKGLCSSASLQAPWQVSLRRPAPGAYAVVYDDEAAGFPAIGTFEVPAQINR